MIKSYTILHYIPSGICWSSSTRPRLCQTRSSMTFCVKWKHTIVSILSWKIARKSPTTSNKPIKISHTKTWWTWKSAWNKNEKSRTTKILHPCSKLMVGLPWCETPSFWTHFNTIETTTERRRRVTSGEVRSSCATQTVEEDFASKGRVAGKTGVGVKPQGPSRYELESSGTMRCARHPGPYNPETPQKFDIDTNKWPIFQRSRHFQTIILGIHVSFRALTWNIIKLPGLGLVLQKSFHAWKSPQKYPYQQWCNDTVALAATNGTTTIFHEKNPQPQGSFC